MVGFLVASQNGVVEMFCGLLNFDEFIGLDEGELLAVFLEFDDCLKEDTDDLFMCEVSIIAGYDLLEGPLAKHGDHHFSYFFLFEQELVLH